jgi:hypothetical protein
LIYQERRQFLRLCCDVAAMSALKDQGVFCGCITDILRLLLRMLLQSDANMAAISGSMSV